MWWAEKLPPFLPTSITVVQREKERSGPKVEGERMKRGGVGVEMCSRSSLESYNFILLILRGWKLLLSPHLQFCLLLFFSTHFCLQERGVAVVKVSSGSGKREERESNSPRQPVLLLWPQDLHARIPQGRELLQSRLDSREPDIIRINESFQIQLIYLPFLNNICLF